MKRKIKKTRAKKTSHTHEYVPCVFEFDGLRLDVSHSLVHDEPRTVCGFYCPLCGKLSMESCRGGFDWEKDFTNGCFSTPSEIEKAQMNPETRTVETFHLDSPWVQRKVKRPKKKRSSGEKK